MLQALGPAGLRAWCVAGLDLLAQAREEIDGLNVFPVPDGDTGTNLQLTMTAVVEALAATTDDAGVVPAVVRGSLMGARGNSGVILSQLLRGLCEALGGGTGPELAGALLASATGAYDAVGVPVEGTVLTVAREAAEAVRGSRADLAGVVATASRAAGESLARTPDLLPALREAGVVDAGGRGWCVLLQALEQVVTGTAAVRTVVGARPTAPSGATAHGVVAFDHEVQFLLEGASDDAVERLRAELGALGDSLVVVGSDGLHKVHVHVTDVGAALEAGARAGSPSQTTVTRFADQVGTCTERPGRDGRPGRDERPGRRRVVAVVQGAGLEEIFRLAGAEVVTGGPSASPSTRELLDAVRASRVGEVVLLPNDGNICAVAEAAAAQARLEGLSVRVLPTRSVLEGLAALSVANGAIPFDDDVACMAAAAAGTCWAEVTTAVRTAGTPAGPCRAGDVLGLLEGDVVVIGADVQQVARDLLARMVVATSEVVTVVLGRGTTPAHGERLTTHLADRDVEVVVLDGGQLHRPLLLGVE